MDAGDFLWQRDLKRLRAVVTVKALSMMQYDVLNVSDGELSFGMDFLDKYTAPVQKEIISTNIFKKNKQVWKPYVMKTLNGVKVAVLGVVSPKFVDSVPALEDQIEVCDPETVLKSLLPRLKKEVHLIVLLSHTGWDQSIRLANNVDGIDFMIVGHDYYPTFDPVTVRHTVLLKSSVGGKHLGEIKVRLDARGKVKQWESDLIELSSHIQTYPEYTLPEAEFEKKKKWLTH